MGGPVLRRSGEAAAGVTGSQTNSRREQASIRNIGASTHVRAANLGGLFFCRLLGHAASRAARAANGIERATMRVLVIGIPDIADDDYFEAPQA